MPKKPDVPGSARKGDIDMRSTDADGKQADEVQSHAERAKKQPADGDKPRDETKGAFKDQVGR
ncbi:MAG: hypothetical protein V4653_17010 [Pseudomonadota bacterium]